MNILVTGGAGYIGSHTVVVLAEAGLNPIIVDDFSNAEKSVIEGLEAITGRTLRWYEADCNDLSAMRKILRESNIDGLIHFAAFKAVGESKAEPLKYYRNNLGSLVAVLEAMQAEQVSAFIFSSSCTVYWPPEVLPVTETSPIPPAMSVYAYTKQISEQILRDVVASGKPLRAYALRYFNPIGAHPSGLIGELPRGVPNNLVPFITQSAAGLRNGLTVYGTDYPTADGSCIRDYIHVMDLAEAHVSALQKLLALQQPSFFDEINIGTGAGVSVLEVIKTFEEVSGESLSYRMGERRPGDVAAVYADAQKAQKELGWRAKRSMREALEDAWRWQRNLMQAEKVG